MRCCICDDDETSLRTLEAMFIRVTDQDNWTTKIFSDADSLMAYLYKQRPEMLIMDIDLNGANGIELVNKIHKSHPGLPVIFISGYISFYSAVYEAEHMYFLTKPVNEEIFVKAIEKVRKQIDGILEKQLLVKNRDAITYVRYEDILYIETSGRKVRVYTTDCVLEAYMSIEDLRATLDSRFVHCHKSYLVNMDFVRTKYKNKFILKNGFEITIAHTRLAQTKAAYLAHLGESL
ncbi:MAG: LytTR family DNA-binding domain-containing protein [Clostridiales bacterium]|jgi:DNA-binding LytR/AlgR family response regulator|nr:LytTR family DNA-binding domain-containing protein [Clostridiales bacterium]